jgi:hypothetical protein
VTNQLVRQRRQPLDLMVGPAVFDRHVLALGNAKGAPPDYGQRPCSRPTKRRNATMQRLPKS